MILVKQNRAKDCRPKNVVSHAVCVSTGGFLVRACSFLYIMTCTDVDLHDVCRSMFNTGKSFFFSSEAQSDLIAVQYKDIQTRLFLCMGKESETERSCELLILITIMETWRALTQLSPRSLQKRRYTIENNHINIHNKHNQFQY